MVILEKNDESNAFIPVKEGIQKFIFIVILEKNDASETVIPAKAGIQQTVFMNLK